MPFSQQTVPPFPVIQKGTFSPLPVSRRRRIAKSLSFHRHPLRHCLVGDGFPSRYSFIAAHSAFS